MTTLADRTIEALRVNHDALAAQVAQLDGADLARGSGASEWTVAQVLSHLGSGAEIMLATFRAAVSGTDDQDDSFNQSVWDRWDGMSPRDQADGFVRTNEELVAAFEALDDTTRQELRVDMGFLPFPLELAGFTGMRLNEAALHAWDVRVAFEPSTTLTGQEADVLLDQLAGPIGFMLGFAGKPDAAQGAGATLRVETTSPHRFLGLTVGSSMALGPAPDDSDAVLTIPAEALLRLFAGRLAPERTPAAVLVSGETVTLDQLRTVFPGF